MTPTNDSLRAAAKVALKLRAGWGYSMERPCDVYELISRLGLELQFFGVPTLEGMYLEDDVTRRVCVSALRPAGRQRFTAAHELGHSVLLHGTKLDSVQELREQNENDNEERCADTFASSLLMPSSAVYSGFKLRDLDIQAAMPASVYRVATWLGVGYSTLCNHLTYSMKAISTQTLKQLLRCELKHIKNQIARLQTSRDVFDLDPLWENQVIHAQVGDFFNRLVSVSSGILTRIGSGMFVAEMPGETGGRLASGRSVRIRVSRESYVGFYEYRYVPEED